VKLNAEMQGSKELITKLSAMGLAIDIQRMLLDTATQTNPRVQKRIMSGLDVRDRPVKAYSDRPSYFSVSQPGMKSLASKARGKNPNSDRYKNTGQKTVQKKGNKWSVVKQQVPRRSVYCPGGYAELRRLSGRSDTKDRFVWTYRMLNSMTPRNAGKNSAMILLVRAIEQKKMGGAVKRFGMIWGLGRRERSFAEQYMFSTADKALQKAMEAK